MNASPAAPPPAPISAAAPVPAPHPLLRELRGRLAESAAMVLLCSAGLALLLAAYLALAPEPQGSDALYTILYAGLALPFLFGFSVSFWRFRFRRIGARWGFVVSVGTGLLLATLAELALPRHSLFAFLGGWWGLLASAGYLTGIGLDGLPRALLQRLRRTQEPA